MVSDVRSALLDAARHELAEHGAGGVSLRAVARRAGVSHAAPKHHFGDRAGLLTVLATDGHRRLADALVRADDGGLAAQGRAYLDFGLENAAIFDLMFRNDQLHPDDPELVAARRASSAPLVETVGRASTGGAFGGDQPVGHLALTAWAFVHGLVVLVRDGALHDLAARSAPGGRPDGGGGDDGGGSGRGGDGEGDDDEGDDDGGRGTDVDGTGYRDTAALARALTDTFTRAMTTGP